jgi:hypothetical protein
MNDQDLVTDTIAILRADKPDALNHIRALYAVKLVPPVDPVDTFHNHLDRCDRCRRMPFDLCATGRSLLAVTGRNTIQVRADR